MRLRTAILVAAVVLSGCSTGHVVYPAATSRELEVGDQRAVERTEQKFDRHADGVFAVSTDDLRQLVVRVEVQHATGLALGSGVIVCTGSGYASILTASHVISGGGPVNDYGEQPEEYHGVKRIDVAFLRGDKRSTTSTAGRSAVRVDDRALDVALLRVPVPRDVTGLRTARFGTAVPVRPGDSLRTIGHSSVTGKEWLPDYLTVNEAAEFVVFRPALDTGYSGGPLFDSRGMLVGISSHVLKSLTQGVPIRRALSAVRASLDDCPALPS